MKKLLIAFKDGHTPTSPAVKKIDAIIQGYGCKPLNQVIFYQEVVFAFYLMTPESESKVGDLSASLYGLDAIKKYSFDERIIDTNGEAGRNGLVGGFEREASRR